LEVDAKKDRYGGIIDKKQREKPALPEE